MSRNSLGVYTPAPVVNPVVDGTLITAAWGNDTVNDISTALTDSLDRQGRGAMLAPLKLFDGSASAPGLSFANETTTGLYRAGAGDIRFRMSGSTLLGFTAAGVTAQTQSPGDNSTLLASTAFVTAAISAIPVLVGNVVQRVSSFVGTLATGTTLFPLTSSVPTNTQGDQYISQAITPANAANILVIEGQLTLSSSSTSAAGYTIAAALFQDSISNALALAVTATAQVNSAGTMMTVPFRHVMVAGTTSPITFKVRGGTNAAASTTTLNGSLGTVVGGGVMASHLTITEYKA